MVREYAVTWLLVAEGDDKRPHKKRPSGGAQGLGGGRSTSGQPLYHLMIVCRAKAVGADLADLVLPPMECGGASMEVRARPCQNSAL